MVEQASRLTAVETEVRMIGRKLDDVDKKLDLLAEEFREFRGETKARWGGSNNKQASDSQSGKLLDFVKVAFIALITALTTLAGVKLGGGT